MSDHKLTVAVTGVSGFVGRVVCCELTKRGHHVRKIVRSSSEHDMDTVQVTDINEQTDWRDALSGGVEVVVHLAARVHVMRDEAANPLEEFRKVNAAGTERLARAAAAAGVRRLVYVSTIKVNGEATSGEKRFSEEDAPAPQDPYGVSKWEAEVALHRVAEETGLEVVIVRPPLVYGAGVKGNFAQMLKALVRGIPLPLASIDNRRSLVYVGNLADALIACATHPDAAGQTYLVSDGEDVSTPALLRRLALAMGARARIFPFPVSLLRLIAAMLGKSAPMGRLTGSLRVNSDKIRAQLGWVPPFSLQQGIAKTVTG